MKRGGRERDRIAFSHESGEVGKCRAEGLIENPKSDHPIVNEMNRLLFAAKRSADVVIGDNNVNPFHRLPGRST